LITKEDGQIDLVKLQHVMNELNLNACPVSNDTANQEECLQRNCSILWKYYIQRKHNRNKHWKKCGDSIQPPGVLNSECSEANSIADHLFAERNNLAYRPEDLAFLYDLSKLESSAPGTSATHKISKKRGDAVLKISKANPVSIRGNNLMRFLCVNNPELSDYFLSVYSLEVGTMTPQPTRKNSNSTNMYILLESMVRYKNLSVIFNREILIFGTDYFACVIMHCMVYGNSTSWDMFTVIMHCMVYGNSTSWDMFTVMSTRIICYLKWIFQEL